MTMTREIIEARMESAQAELSARTTEAQNLQNRFEEVGQQIHNLRVQIATYSDLLTDNTEAASETVRETVESLVSGE